MKNGNDNFALVQRPPNAIEKSEPGAKRVIAMMISDTLAIAPKHLTPAFVPPTDAEIETWCQHGQKYYCGRGVSRDYVEAAKWFRKAAEQGLAAAQHNLGVYYRDGEGVPQDYVEAVKWYRWAAEEGNACAQFNLGVCFQHGRGVKADRIEAYKLFSLAEAQGQKGAAEAVVSVGALLSLEECQEAERRYNEYKAGHQT